MPSNITIDGAPGELWNGHPRARHVALRILVTAIPLVPLPVRIHE